MKVIDLLNKIANGEELPKAINSETGSICYYLYDKCGEQCDDRNLCSILNDEVEIIEEHKIPEKLDYIHPDISCSYNESELLLRIEANKDKINEILDYLEEIE